MSPYLRHMSYTFRSSCVYFCSRHSLLTCSSCSLRSSSLFVSSCLVCSFCSVCFSCFFSFCFLRFFLFFSRFSRLVYLVYSSPPKSPPTNRCREDLLTRRFAQEFQGEKTIYKNSLTLLLEQNRFLY